MSTHGTVLTICIAPTSDDPMQELTEVMAIAGAGLEGDRYCGAAGSYNRDRRGKRQVTLMNATFFNGLHVPYEFPDTRRNLLVQDVELMWLIDREFEIGAARFRGVKYCDPCDRPGRMLRRRTSFRDLFQDRGGLIAEVIEGGLIRVGDAVIPPPKGY